jgi:hypothetical protein
LVLAYHGCALETAQKLLGGSSFLPSRKDYDWLGAGFISGKTMWFALISGPLKPAETLTIHRLLAR